MCRLLDRDFQPSSYNDYDFSLPPQYQGTACVLYATAIISKLFSTKYPDYLCSRKKLVKIVMYEYIQNSQIGLALFNAQRQKHGKLNTNTSLKVEVGFI